MPVDALTEPVPERAKLPLLQLGIQLGEIASRGLPDLGSENVAERIGGKVTEQAARPVNVLQHADRVVGRRNSEILLHRRVPGVRQLLDLDSLAKQVTLELEPQQ